MVLQIAAKPTIASGVLQALLSDVGVLEVQQQAVGAVELRNGCISAGHLPDDRQVEIG